MAIEPLDDQPEWRFGHLGPLLVAVWKKNVTLEALASLEAVHDRLHATYGPLTVVSVVLGDTAPPAPHVRQRLMRSFADQSGLRRANVVLVHARGLAAIIATTVIAALSRLGKQKLEVFRSTAEAVAFVRAVPGQDPLVSSAEDLEAQVTAFTGPRR